MDVDQERVDAMAKKMVEHELNKKPIKKWRLIIGLVGLAVGIAWFFYLVL